MIRLGGPLVLLCALGCANASRNASPAEVPLSESDPRIRSLLHGATEEERVQAMKELAQIGSAAVPALAKLLESPDVDDVQGAWIAETLGDMGPVAEPAAPALAARLARGGDCSATTSWALGQIGPAGVPWLIQALMTGKPKGRAWAADALRNAGSDAREAIPALAAALGDDVAEVRAEAAFTLAHIGAPARAQLPRVLSLLEDGDVNVRIAALAACEALETGEPAVVNALIRRLRRDSSNVARERAAEILGGMGAPARAAQAALREALRDDDEVRDAARKALERIAGDDG